ncbi:unnamed protein product [Cuscuta campestris]|uniref:Myb/SANT-like domain-containing protein n=1 Tax=Cuscuta campestris TaxID=132261 RepID=A0A484M401_9ASTE|nr:unnamed protein product [Cuscuta campestris]
MTSTQIESKVKQFREKHNVIMVMFGTSGFSWDDTNKMIKCERQSYDEFLKNAKGLWVISFPFLDDLDKVSGAYRANGGACEDYEEAVETLQTDNEAAGINNDVFGEDKGGMTSHFSTIASAFSTTQEHDLAIMAREEGSEAKKRTLKLKKKAYSIIP